MAEDHRRTSWIVDGNRIATKIKCASGVDPRQINWKSDPRRACPKCDHVIDNSDEVKKWPGLPRGVKFDPSDTEIIWHLLTKSGLVDQDPHPFIDEFIPTLVELDGICYAHPKNLPGVKQDGSSTHFFHRAVKAYNTGTRKRRKINGDDLDVRWHKTGRTKPVFLANEQKGCKKIMVLYSNSMKGVKSEKTNWVMHQYHLGTEEEEKDGEFVVSKVFYQQQQGKANDKNLETSSDLGDDVVGKVDPVTPKSVTPEPRTERRSSLQPREQPNISYSDSVAQECLGLAETVRAGPERHGDETESRPEEHLDHDQVTMEPNNDQAGDDIKLSDSQSQYLIDSQQLVEGLSLLDDFFQSQSPNRDGNETDARRERKPGLSDYARLGKEHFKKELQECQDLELDPANIDIDTPPDFRLSQLEFGSQDSYVAWGGGKSL